MFMTEEDDDDELIRHVKTSINKSFYSLVEKT